MRRRIGRPGSPGPPPSDHPNGDGLLERFLALLALAACGALPAPAADAPPLFSPDPPDPAAAALVNAKKGRLKHGFAFCGQNAYRVDRIMPVKELIATLTAEFEQAANA